MDRIVKVFCSGADQARLAEQYPVVERYEAFVLLKVPASAQRRLARQYLVEDITDLYQVRPGAQAIDTSIPRYNARGKTLSHPAYKQAKPLGPGPHHYLVQFLGPIKDEWLKGVERAGGQPRALQSDFTYIVRADEEALQRVAALPYVRWVGHLPHADRVAPSVLANIGRAPDDTSSALPRTRVRPATYAVEFFTADNLRKATAAVKRLGLTLLSQDPTGKVLLVETKGNRAQRLKQIQDLSAVHGVRMIREHTLKRISNDVAAGILGTAQAMSNPKLGLSGKGEVIGVCDTGLDTGDPQMIHQDLAGRVTWVKSYPMTADFAPYVTNPNADDGPADFDSGHGTHVAGSVLGNGAASLGLPGLALPIRGLAYEARLIFQAVEQAMKWKNPAFYQKYGHYLLAGIPNDLKDLFAEAYAQGARIHSNSWGGGDPGAYDHQCQQLDEFVWEHKDFCILVAAGNDGTDMDGDGKINPMSVTSPATAKNCITVGACENLRPGFNTETYGEWWPNDYPVGPFKTDPMANNPNQVVAFSSRGPTQDGRVKPEVVSPGTFILSTRSTMIAPNNMAWAGFPPSRSYFHMGGTSMATPLAAGAVGLVREYLRRKKRFKSPSAALLKATLIAGAERLPGTAPQGTVLDSHQGFGRVNLDAVLAPPAPIIARFVEVRSGIRTGQMFSLRAYVKSDGAPLRVALAYTDFPGESLVNNLNLLVQGPDGTTHVGNQREGGPLTPDAENNAEAVRIGKPAAGAWQIQVVGSNVPQGPQPFALVCTGHLGWVGNVG